MEPWKFSLFKACQGNRNKIYIKQQFQVRSRRIWGDLVMSARKLNFYIFNIEFSPLACSLKYLRNAKLSQIQAHLDVSSEKCDYAMWKCNYVILLACAISNEHFCYQQNSWNEKRFNGIWCSLMNIVWFFLKKILLRWNSRLKCMKCSDYTILCTKMTPQQIIVEISKIHFLMWIWTQNFSPVNQQIWMVHAGLATSQKTG